MDDCELHHVEDTSFDVCYLQSTHVFLSTISGSSSFTADSEVKLFK